MDASTSAALVFVVAFCVVFAGLAARETECAWVTEVDADQTFTTAGACVAAFASFGGFTAEGKGEGRGGFFAFVASATLGVVVLAFVFVALFNTERSGFGEGNTTKRLGLITAHIAGVADFSDFGDGGGWQAESFGGSEGDGAGFTACFVANGVRIVTGTLALASAFIADKAREAVGFGGLGATDFKVAARAGVDFGEAEGGGGVEGGADGRALAVEEVGAAFSAEASGAFDIGDDTAKVLCSVTKFLNGGVASLVSPFDKAADLGFSCALVEAFFVAAAVGVLGARGVAIAAIFDAVDDTSEAEVASGDGGGGTFAKSAFTESFGVADLAFLGIFGDVGAELDAAVGVGVAGAFTKARCGGISGDTGESGLAGFGGSTGDGALGFEGEFGGVAGFFALEFFALDVGAAVPIGVAGFEAVAVSAQAVEDADKSGLTGLGFAAEFAEAAEGDIGGAFDDIFGIGGGFAAVDAGFVFVAEGLFVEAEFKARSAVDAGFGGGIAVFAETTDSDERAARGGLSAASVFQTAGRAIGVDVFGGGFGLWAIDVFFGVDLATIGVGFGVGFGGIFFDIAFNGAVVVRDALFVGGAALTRGAGFAVVAEFVGAALEPRGGREQQKERKWRESAHKESVHAKVLCFLGRSVKTFLCEKRRTQCYLCSRIA